MNERLVVRFSGVERFAHLLYFVSFLILAATGFVLYVPLATYAAGDVGALNRLVHRAAAVGLMAAPVIYLLFDPRGLLTSLGLILRWSRDDVRWLGTGARSYWSGSRAGIPPQDKFNTGQKLNALLQVLCFVTFVATGLALWFWATTVSAAVFRALLILHDVAFVGSSALVLVHVYLAAFHPLTRKHIGTMVDGTMAESAARELHPLWYERIRSGAGRGR